MDIKEQRGEDTLKKKSAATIMKTNAHKGDRREKRNRTLSPNKTHHHFRI